MLTAGLEAKIKKKSMWPMSEWLKDKQVQREASRKNGLTVWIAGKHLNQGRLSIL